MSKSHARWSPSTLERKEHCVRFESLEYTEAGDEGTELHAATENEGMTGLSDEQQNAVQICLEYKNNVLAKCSKVSAVSKEVQVALKDLTYGTVDMLIVDGAQAHILDWKFGRKGVTEADQNFQLQTYAAAVFETYSPVETVTGHLVSPRLKVTSSHTWDRSMVAGVRARIEALYAKIANPFTQATPHEDTCGMCQWAANCPALGTVAVTVAKGVGLPMPEVFAPDALVKPEDRATAQAIASALETWCEQIKKNNAKYVAETGGEVPGYALITRSTGKKIPKDATMLALLRIKENGYATEEQTASAMTISIPELAKVMVTVRGTTEVAERERILGFMADVVQEGQCQFLQKVKKTKKELKA